MSAALRPMDHEKVDEQSAKADFVRL